ncbi:MAG: DUF4058 family protein [Chloroflexaceae bacterium]|nr:DUF4058 family protein [Chloroflexaceae bacterium]
MPTPFPGMDPYLEGDEWTSFHAELCSEIARQLAPKLRPTYVVRPVRRFVAETLDDVTITSRDMYPDVSVATNVQIQPPRTAFVAPAPLEVATIIPAQIPITWLEIRDVANRTLVTAIEVLSPANKRGEGYQEYLDKRRRLLYSSAHLVEIDVLRAGRRVPTQEPLPDAAYFIFVSRAERRPYMSVWPVALQERLPLVPIPLLPGDADVMLDVQEALGIVYDSLSFDLSLNYRQPPTPPLAEADAAWADELLHAAGLR